MGGAYRDEEKGVETVDSGTNLIGGGEDVQVEMINSTEGRAVESKPMVDTHTHTRGQEHF